jgi:hypothetical protein
VEGVVLRNGRRVGFKELADRWARGGWIGGFMKLMKLNNSDVCGINQK